MTRTWLVRRVMSADEGKSVALNEWCSGEREWGRWEVRKGLKGARRSEGGEKGGGMVVEGKEDGKEGVKLAGRR